LTIQCIAGEKELVPSEANKPNPEIQPKPRRAASRTAGPSFSESRSGEEGESLLGAKGTGFGMKGARTCGPPHYERISCLVMDRERE